MKRRESRLCFMLNGTMKNNEVHKKKCPSSNLLSASNMPPMMLGSMFCMTIKNEMHTPAHLNAIPISNRREREGKVVELSASKEASVHRVMSADSEYR